VKENITRESIEQELKVMELRKRYLRTAYKLLNIERSLELAQRAADKKPPEEIEQC